MSRIPKLWKPRSMTWWQWNRLSLEDKAATAVGPPDLIKDRLHLRLKFSTGFRPHLGKGRL